jgi:prepilin-type N-terminal cleavage/methylation domain-containing protein
VNNRQFTLPLFVKQKSVGQTMRNSGFTLIELLVVAAIIALLAMLGFFAIGNIKAKSRDVRRVADIKSIQEGLLMYYDNHQLYPIYDGYLSGSDDMSTALVNDGVIRTVPIDPLNKVVGETTYKYYYQSTQGRTYLIEYYLETDSIQGKSKGLNEAKL